MINIIEAVSGKEPPKEHDEEYYLLPDGIRVKPGDKSLVFDVSPTFIDLLQTFKITGPKGEVVFDSLSGLNAQERPVLANVPINTGDTLTLNMYGTDGNEIPANQVVFSAK